MVDDGAPTEAELEVMRRTGKCPYTEEGPERGRWMRSLLCNLMKEGVVWISDSAMEAEEAFAVKLHHNFMRIKGRSEVSKDTALSKRFTQAKLDKLRQ